MMLKKIVAGFLAITLCFLVWLPVVKNDDGETTDTNTNTEVSINDDPYVPFPPYDEDDGDNEGDNSGIGSSNNGSDSDVAPTSNTVRVTLTEGMTLVKMSWALEDAGVCSSEAFIEAAQNTDFFKISPCSRCYERT